jgi:predicted P-loop ATPase
MTPDRDNQDTSEDTSPIVSPFAIEKTTEKIKKANILRERGSRRSDQAIAYPYNASDAKGNPKSTLDNVVIFLENSPRFRNIENQEIPPLYYDAFYNYVLIEGERQTDTNMSGVRIYIEQDSGIEKVGKDLVWDAVDYVAEKNKLDHAVQKLEQFAEAWDGKERMYDWLHHAIPGTPNDDYHRAIGFSWLLAMAKRQINPGVPFKYILTLIGRQSLGKTPLFETLVKCIDDDAVKNVGDISKPDTVLALSTGTLIGLFDEGVKLGKEKNEEVKEFVARTADTIRAPYGRAHKTFKRRWVCGMTENNFDALTDSTGNDRYWVVEVTQLTNFAWLEENREQLLGEAYMRAKRGEDYIFPDRKYANEIQNRHRQVHPWEEMVLNWLLDQKSYLNNPRDYNLKGVDLWTDALKGSEESFARLDFNQRRDISNVMKALGFVNATKWVDGKNMRIWKIQPGSEQVHLDRISDFKEGKNDFAVESIDIDLDDI